MKEILVTIASIILGIALAAMVISYKGEMETINTNTVNKLKSEFNLTEIFDKE